MSDHEEVYPLATRELAAERKRLAPNLRRPSKRLAQSVFAEGALPVKTKQLIAVAVAHVTQCPYCIRGHTSAALQHGATAEEIMEAIWVAAEMRAGGAYAHSALALDTIARTQGQEKRAFRTFDERERACTRVCVFNAKHCSCSPFPFVILFAAAYTPAGGMRPTNAALAANP